MKCSAKTHGLLSLVVLVLTMSVPIPAPAATSLPSPTTEVGFISYLLINEVAFPGEQAYRSESDSLAAMDSILNVLVNRLRFIPPPYRQSQIAAVTTDNILDIITAGGVHGQVEGFYRDSSGRLRIADRVGQRINHLVAIANQGSPGRFARMLNHAVGVVRTYTADSSAPPARFADVTGVNGVAATGRAYSWMTDKSHYNPGGNFLRISNSQGGSLSGNRFFTLRKNPR